MSGSLDHALIRQLFDELSAALEARGVRGHVYLIGGGAMITGYGRVSRSRRRPESEPRVRRAARGCRSRTRWRMGSLWRPPGST